MYPEGQVIAPLRLGAALLTAAGWAAGATQPLDIEPGLWEIALTVRTIGKLPIPAEALAKMTPQQRASIDARPAEPRNTVKRSCLREEELEQPLVFSFGGAGQQACQETVMQALRNRQEIHVECSKGGGTIQVEAADRKNVTVSSQWTATDGAHTVHLNSTAKLKWLGASCDARAVPEPREPVRPTTPQPTPKVTAATQDAGSYYDAARKLIDRSDFPGALRALNQAIELDPRQAASYNARGYVYLRLKNYTTAGGDFTEAIRLRPDYANAYKNRATARRRSGDEKGAAEDEHKAAQLQRR